MRGFQKCLVALIMIFGLGIMAYSGYHMFSITRERNASKSANQMIADNAVTYRTPQSASPSAEKDSPAPTQASDSPQETDPPQPPETAPLSVDFDYLLGINRNVVAWIYCEDTPISYPVVLSADNSDYLYRLIDGTTNSSGSLFMDFRNAGDLSDSNSIIYGHNMKDGSMFASVEQYCRQEYYDQHPVMYLMKPSGDYKLELIAGKTVRADDESVYTTDLTVEAARKRMENSDFQSSVQLQPEDRFVTLSTCAYSFNSARYVVLGVLRPLA